MSTVLPTPFHVRTAEHNTANAWVERGPFTVPAHFSVACQEALAARFSCVLADVSPLQDLRIAGRGAEGLLGAACGSAVRSLKVGRSRPIHWCADGGGLRGSGTLVRAGEHEFLLRSADADMGWFETAAPRFGATVRNTTNERGVLLLTGPFAGAVLAAAGLDAAASVEPDQHASVDWRGIPIVLARDLRLKAFQIACAAEDGVLVFDRVVRAGTPLGLRLAGQEALELLQLEAGIPLVHVDYAPARENFSTAPLPSSLGLGPTPAGNGKPPVFAGIEFDSEEAQPFVPLYRDDAEVGRTLRSAYSLALRRAIALAELDPAHAAPGTMLTVRASNGTSAIDARVVALPFL